MKKKRTRRLTVYDIYFQKDYRNNPLIVPYIRLCGKWLQELGFTQGQKILITTEKNKIIITPDSSEGQKAA